MKNSKLDEKLKEYKNAVKNSDDDKIKEIEKFFRELGIEPLGLRIIAFT